METRKTLYVTSREEWRAWLTKHYQAETEVWLIYYKKHTGQPRISYDHAGTARDCGSCPRPSRLPSGPA